MVKCYRQGDVLLVEVARRPSDARAVPREQGRLVLAHGEATGHAHVVADAGAELVTREQAEELYLLVHGTEVVLEHEEHEAITLPPGSYRVIRQREYAPDSVRFVAD
jgi:hypothetical protein